MFTLVNCVDLSGLPPQGPYSGGLPSIGGFYPYSTYYGGGGPPFSKPPAPKPAPPGVGPLFYFDAYTGTGEVVAAARIGQLLSAEGRSFGIERSRIVSYEEIRNSNVIFLGASLEDSILRKLPVEADLVFHAPAQQEFVGSLVIQDRRAPPGQPSVYKLQRDPQNRAMEGEYALISLLPGLIPDRYIMVLAGISTIGTQAAAEFATSAESMQKLARMLAGPSSKKTASPYFQALLRVQIRDGTAAKAECLFVRELTFRR
jgi:hypothetical protein